MTVAIIQKFVQLVMLWIVKCVWYNLLQDFDGNDVEFEPTIAQTVAGTGQISFKYASSNLTGITDMILRASFLSTENVSKI